MQSEMKAAGLSSVRNESAKIKKTTKKSIHRNFISSNEATKKLITQLSAALDHYCAQQVGWIR